MFAAAVGIRSVRGARITGIQNTATVAARINIGAVAQLGERVVRNDEVGSSILLGSTILYAPVAQLDRASAS